MLVLHLQQQTTHTVDPTQETSGHYAECAALSIHFQQTLKLFSPSAIYGPNAVFRYAWCVYKGFDVSLHCIWVEESCDSRSKMARKHKWYKKRVRSVCQVYSWRKCLGLRDLLGAVCAYGANCADADRRKSWSERGNLYWTSWVTQMHYIWRLSTEWEDYLWRLQNIQKCGFNAVA